jgi:hypothetical protein
VLKQFVLQIAIKAVNNTAGPDGLVPTLLVFSTYPRMTTTDTLSLTVTERGKAITKAIKQIAELHAKRQVTDVLKQRNGPNINDILDVLISKDVLIYKEDKGWKGPYTFVLNDSQTCTVTLLSGLIRFRITSVKRYYSKDFNT